MRTQPYVLFDRNSNKGNCLLFENALDTIRADRPEEVLPALKKLERVLENGGWAAGFLSYEMGYCLEARLRPRLPDSRNVPLLWLGVFSAPSECEISEICSSLPSSSGLIVKDLIFSISQEEYQERFYRVKKYILSGDVYQVNLTFKAKFKTEALPISLYTRMRKRQCVQFGAIIETGDISILSSSPELFLPPRGFGDLD